MTTQPGFSEKMAGYAHRARLGGVGSERVRFSEKSRREAESAAPERLLMSEKLARDAGPSLATSLYFKPDLVMTGVRGAKKSRSWREHPLAPYLVFFVIAIVIPALFAWWVNGGALFSMGGLTAFIFAFLVMVFTFGRT